MSVSANITVRKTTISLSDGRELSYFDTGPPARRDEPDRRGLSPVRPQAELRYDQFQGTWVMYASHRQDRTYLPGAADCPLCPSTADRATEIPARDYEVVVFENRFPALTSPAGDHPAWPGGGGDGGPEPGGRPDEVLAARPSAGRCEVICFTSDHNASFADLPPDRVRLVTEALIDRTAALSALPGVAQVYCFENRGREIGVTQPHPHGQIYAYPFVTPRTTRALEGALAYARRTGRNLADDVLAAGRAAGERVVLAGTHWTAFVPHAARWPYEVHLYPHRRVPDLASLLPEERAELATAELELLRRFARLFDEPAPYISAWHQAPVAAGREHLALHLELFTMRRSNDKLKYLAGSESGMDAFANDILPEHAAARLRELG
jgi:UDPglucose--hexose-1-phosphate uridylyltransferase